MAQDPDSVAFSNNFWGKDDVGVTNLLQKMHDSKLCLEEVHAFYKERISIEEDYARRMLALSRKGLGSTETGSLRQALDVIRTNTESMGKSHAGAAQQFKSQLSGPLDTFSSSIRSRRKTQQATIEKLTKAKQAQNQAAEKARSKFETDCNKINGYYAQQNLLMGKELEKNNAKLDKVHQTVDFTKREYQNSLRSLAETIDRWNTEWKNACDKFQDLEEERINFMKSNLWGYANIVSSVCVADDDGCENIRMGLEKCDAAKDIEAFVREKGTGSEIQDPPEFVNFMSGYNRDTTTSGYRIANFKRESEEGAAAAPATSAEEESSQVPVEPLEQEPVQDTTSHLPPITQPPPLNTNSIKHSHSNSVPQLNLDTHAHDDDEDYNSIPVLAHPDDASSAQTSPIQRSPNSSVYSATTSVSSVSISGGEEDEPKKRTWASPFRRRSKKDLSKGWNSPSAPSTATASPATIKQSKKDDLIKSKMSPGSVLSMGENMFDLGVNTGGSRSGGSKSPFDTRSRSNSPTKNMSRDDPLVQALEKLKTGNDSTPSKYGSIGGGAVSNNKKRVPSQSAPVSPVKQNGQFFGGRGGSTKATTALVPPQPAFTSADMESTSSKYYNQTQELFDQQQQQHQQMARPKSHIDLRDNPYPQQTLRQRPKSFYYEQPEEHYEEPQQQRPQYRHSRSKSASPIKQNYADYQHQQQQPQPRAVSPAPSYRRSVSPAPSATQQNPYRRSVSPAPSQQQYQDPYRRSVSPAPSYQRSVSPAPARGSRAASPNPYARSTSPAPVQQQRPRSKTAADLNNGGSTRGRMSKSQALPAVAPDGRKVLRYSKAAYDYRQAIPEEVSFRKGDILMATECLADGWWYCFVYNTNRSGLAPSNFLVDL